jgi:hypothetical protein
MLKRIYLNTHYMYFKRITIYQDGDRNTILIRGNFEDLVPQMYTFFFCIVILT